MQQRTNRPMDRLTYRVADIYPKMVVDFLPNILAPPSEVEVSDEKYTHKI